MDDTMTARPSATGWIPCLLVSKEGESINEVSIQSINQLGHSLEIDRSIEFGTHVQFQSLETLGGVEGVSLKCRPGCSRTHDTEPRSRERQPTSDDVSCWPPTHITHTAFCRHTKTDPPYHTLHRQTAFAFRSRLLAAARASLRPRSACLPACSLLAADCNSNKQPQAAASSQDRRARPSSNTKCPAARCSPPSTVSYSPSSRPPAAAASSSRRVRSHTQRGEPSSLLAGTSVRPSCRPLALSYLAYV